MKYFSKLTNLRLVNNPKENAFIIVNDDEEGFFLTKLLKEIRKYPKLKQLKQQNLNIFDVEDAEEEDVIIFGDTIDPYNFDYYAAEFQDLKSVNGFDVYELTEEFDEIKEALYEYHKANYPNEHHRLKRRRKMMTTTKKKKKQTAYFSRLTGQQVKDIDIELEIPRILLDEIDEVEIEIELPNKKHSSFPPKKKKKKKSPTTYVLFEDFEEFHPKKKKVNGKKYVVHQNVVKAGLKMYNIFEDDDREEFVRINGTVYEVIRNSGGKDFLVEA